MRLDTARAWASRLPTFYSRFLMHDTISMLDAQSPQATRYLPNGEIFVDPLLARSALDRIMDAVAEPIVGVNVSYPNVILTPYCCNEDL